MVAAKTVNLSKGEDEEQPPMTRMRADKYGQGELASRRAGTRIRIANGSNLRTAQKFVGLKAVTECGDKEEDKKSHAKTQRK
ncbi:MAG: hypothetical protein ACM3U2_08775 [Deltaproteobacteria bacterium]